MNTHSIIKNPTYKIEDGFDFYNELNKMLNDDDLENNYQKNCNKD